MRRFDASFSQNEVKRCKVHIGRDIREEVTRSMKKDSIVTVLNQKHRFHILDEEMSVKNLIVVVGATGNQGGSVVDTFVSEPNWRVRALTRNTSSTKAKALANRGVEVIYADMDDPSTLALAFNGANATFVVSDFWGFYGDPANKDKPTPGQPLNIWAAEHETEQLKNVIDAAAKLSTLEPFVFSSLSNASKCSNGRYTHVYHFDSKAQAEDYGREKYPDLWSKTSILQAGFFLSNFVTNPSMQPFKVKQNPMKSFKRY